MSVSAAPVRWFATLGIADIPEVGGKNASLGEMASHLGAVGVQVPNGFALTASLYREALTAAGAWPRLHALLDTLDVADVTALARTADAARTIVYDATRSSSLRGLIAEAYAKLEAECGAGVAVAVRSSATAEDLPTASFAGQHDSYLNISGLDDVVEACRRCFASLFTDRAVVYRVNNGFDHFKVALSVGVMKMVRSDRAASGVDLYPRHRVRLPRRGVHHRLVRSRRERGAGQGRSGRVLRAQANFSPGSPGGTVPHAWRQATHHGAGTRPFRRHHRRRTDPARAA